MSLHLVETSDRREMPRFRAYLAGKLHWGDAGLESIDCAIRNTSPNGVLVELPTLVLLRSPIRLTFVRDGRIRDATMVWQKGARVALKLGKEYRMIRRAALDVRRISEVRDQLGERPGSEVLHIDVPTASR